MVIDRQRRCISWKWMEVIMDDPNMTEYQYWNFRHGILVLLWFMVPFWIFAGLACLSVLALAGWV
jgi:hypothetical protein